MKIILGLMILAAGVFGCYGFNRNPISRSLDHLTMEANGSSENATAYERYGGESTVQKVVDETWFLLLSDPELEPTFSLVGKTRGESVDQVKSCLDLQIGILLDGPGEIPGVSHTRKAPREGYQCQDLAQTFAELGVTSEEFDKFTWHLSNVLKSHGMSDQDMTAITKSLLSIPPVVTSL